MKQGDIVAVHKQGYEGRIGTIAKVGRKYVYLTLPVRENRLKVLPNEIEVIEG